MHPYLKEGVLVFQNRYEGIRTIMKATLKLLQGLCKGNSHVQEEIFRHLDTLLEIKGVEPELANALIEVNYTIKYFKLASNSLF